MGSLANVTNTTQLLIPSKEGIVMRRRDHVVQKLWTL